MSLSALPHEHFMQLALREAAMAAEDGEVPIGAVIVSGGRILARAHNQVELLKDPTAHAEILAITQAAAALQDWRLCDTVMYVTKEPCPMCAGAIMHARIPSLVFGTPDPERGGAMSVFNILDNPKLNHRTEMQHGILEEPCRLIIQEFFRARRQSAARKADA